MPKLDPKVTPKLAAATETGTAIKSDVTLYLDIDLENGVTDKTDKPFNMTAVYLPDPGAVTDPVTVLLWFCGHKDGTTASLAAKSPPKGPKLNLKRMSIKEYLNVDEYNLREFIGKTSKRKFILVAPTLTDMSGAGLLAQETEAEGFLSQVVNAVNAIKKSTKVNSIGNMLLAAHSGGGSIMSKVIKYGGSFAKVREVWCVDCTYGSGYIFKDWAEKPTSAGGRLWVFSTGSWDKTALPDPKKKEGPDNVRFKVTHLKDPKKPAGPDNPEIQDREGTGDSANDILTDANSHVRARARAVDKAVAAAKAKAKKDGTSEADAAAQAKKDAEAKPDTWAVIEEEIQGSNPGGKTKNWTYGNARGHNESIGDFLPAIIGNSKTLN